LISRLFAGVEAVHQRRKRVKREVSMKKILTALALATMILAPMEQAQAGDRLLEILKGKGIITEEQFQELEKEAKKEVKVSYKDGFKMESEDKEFSLKVNGRVQGDFRYFNDSEKNDTFDIRRAYLSASGTLYKYYDYKVEVDFAGSNGTSSTIKDAYINYKYFKDAQVKIGQFYFPFGNEVTASDRFYVFLESSSIVAALAPGRDRGIEVHGSPMNGLISYQVGIFNGSGENRSETNDDFEYAARVVFHPTAGSEGPLQAWIGGSFAYGQEESLSAGGIRVSTESKSGNNYFSSAAASHGYERTRMGLEGALQYGPAMLKGEFLRTEYDFEKKADIEGGYITASWFLTGEQKNISRDGHIERQKVKKPFDPSKRQWGAWELAVRYSWFEVDDKFFQANGLYPGSPAASATANANEGDSWTAAINWYLNSMTRVMVDWVHSEASNDLSGGTSNIWKHDGDSVADTDAEDALLMRVQIDW